MLPEWTKPKVSSRHYLYLCMTRPWGGRTTLRLALDSLSPLMFSFSLSCSLLLTRYMPFPWFMPVGLQIQVSPSENKKPAVVRSDCLMNLASIVRQVTVSSEKPFLLAICLVSRWCKERDILYTHSLFTSVSLCSTLIKFGCQNLAFRAT